MSARLNITIDDDLFKFVENQAQGNRSAFINKMLRNEYRQWIEAELKRGLLEDMNDPEYLAEIALWDVCVGDGLEDEDETDETQFQAVRNMVDSSGSGKRRRNQKA